MIPSYKKGGMIMFNQTILIGRTTTEPEIQFIDSKYKVVTLDLAVTRPFKNENNEFETDFIPVRFWQNTAERICEYCGKGSLIAVQCRLGSRYVEKENFKTKVIDVIADRVYFINTVPRNKQNDVVEERK